MPHNRLVTCTNAGFVSDSLSQKHTPINRILFRRALYFFSQHFWGSFGV